MTEAPERLNYFDALRALDEASAVLLLGGNEPHYTPSRVFPAILSGRPLLAMYHAESTATDLLRRFGGPPAVHLMSFSSDHPVVECAGDVCAALAALTSRPSYSPDQVDRAALEPSSAPVLAGRLAAIFDRVSAQRSSR